MDVEKIKAFIIKNKVPVPFVGLIIVLVILSNVGII